MFTIDGGHLGKYLATLGVAVVAATFTFTAFILRTPSDLLLKRDDIDELSSTARTAVQVRQEYHLFLIQHVTWVILAGLLAGLALFVVGLFQWRGRQELEDKVLRKQLRDEKPSETAERRREEVLEELRVSADEAADETRPSSDVALPSTHPGPDEGRDSAEAKTPTGSNSNLRPQEPDSSNGGVTSEQLPELVATLASQLEAVERRFITLMQQAYGARFRENVRWGGVGIDGVLKRESADARRVMFEVKYGSALDRVDIARATLRASVVAKSLPVATKPVVVVVTAQPPTPQQMARFERRMSAGGAPEVPVIIYTESELAALTPDELATAIERHL